MQLPLAAIISSIAITCVLLPPLPKAVAEDVPGALAVEWEGKKPCEALYEDEQIRVARCTFPKGVTHVCHSHPSYLSFVISGGQGTVQDTKGTRKVDIVTGALLTSPPVPWHVFANAGDSTIQFLVVEKKYQPLQPVDISACPKS